MAAAALAAALACAGAAGAQSPPERVSINTYGVPGLIDMPSAEMQPDAELVTSVYMLSNASGRTQLTFQITPRLQGVFRYATIPDFLQTGNGFIRTYDRSFDLRYQIFRESGWRPAVTVGLQDFGGTSLFSGEYIVATKHFGDRWTVTGGIGWGRLGTRGGFTNPLGALSDRFETRPGFNVNSRGGTFSSDQVFRGDAALFGGVAYKFNDKLTLKAEYSSDAYLEEEARGVLTPKTPLNFGLDYKIRPGVSLGAYAIQGAEVGINVTFALNPKRPPTGSGAEEAPMPVFQRPSRDVQPDLWTTAWEGNEAVVTPVTNALSASLEEQGLKLTALKLDGGRAEVQFRNNRFLTNTQAMGRAARILSATLPPSVETLVLIPENDVGLTGAAVIIRRTDLEALQYRPDGSDEALAVAGIVDARTLSRDGTQQIDGVFPRFQWALGPYVAYGLFDPDAPLRLDLGIEAKATYEPVRGLLFSGAVRQRIVGNRGDIERGSNSVLPRVRTDQAEFFRTDGPFIDHLTAEYFFRPGRSTYARVSAGLLEQQFGGVSAEFLWKPVQSRWGIGVEVNRVRQREFDMKLGFRDLDATTGFVTGYYNHGNGFHSQLDVGQYLAGDRGATYTLSRLFDNGWEVGAFATKTNVSAEEFGEGSFDKGFFLKIPATWLTGQPSRQRFSTTIRPVQRDGGARLSLRNRLYPKVRDMTGPELTDQWGRFWR
ncbi:MAG: YjbH domain-containing protein [Pseudomonadota bacterium]